MISNNAQMEVSELFLQLISSIRVADGRIDELKMAATQLDLPTPARKEITERVERLVNMRMCLLYSLMDCRLGMIGYCDDTKSANDAFDQDMFKDIVRSFRCRT